MNACSPFFPLGPGLKWLVKDTPEGQQGLPSLPGRSLELSVTLPRVPVPPPRPADL